MWDLPRSGIQPCVPCIGRQIFYHWATREAPWNAILKIPNKLFSYLQPRALFPGWQIWSPDSQSGRAGKGAEGWQAWRCNLGAAAERSGSLSTEQPSLLCLPRRPRSPPPGRIPGSGAGTMGGNAGGSGDATPASPGNRHLHGLLLGLLVISSL